MWLPPSGYSDRGDLACGGDRSASDQARLELTKSSLRVMNDKTQGKHNRSAFGELRPVEPDSQAIDRLAANYLAFAQLASIRLWQRLMSPRPRREAAAANNARSRFPPASVGASAAEARKCARPWARDACATSEY